MAFQDFTISQFGGLNEDNAPDKLEDNELTKAENVAPNGSAFGTRPGIGFEATSGTNNQYHAAISSGVTTPTNIMGLFQMLERNTSESGHLVAAVYDSDVPDVSIFRDSNNAEIDKSTNSVVLGDSATARFTFAEHKNLLYAVGGAAANTDIWKWDGDESTGGAGRLEVVVANGSAPITDPQYIFQKWNYGFIAGNGADTAADNNMLAAYSALNDLETWPAGNTIGGSSAIGGLDSYGANRITGFAEFNAGGKEWLLILTRKRIYSVLQTPDPDAPFFVDDQIANGCVDQRAFVSLGVDSGDAIYISENGIHSLRQSQRHGDREDAYISWKIRETFNNLGAINLKNSSGAFWRREGLVLFAVPTSGTAGNFADRILCLNIRGQQEVTAANARWSVWVPNLGDGVQIVSMTTAQDPASGEEFVYIGTTDAKVGRFNRTAYSDFGNAYEVEWITKHNDFGSPRLTKRLGDILIRGQITGGTDDMFKYQPVFDIGNRTGRSTDVTFKTGTQAQWSPAAAGGTEALWEQFEWGSLTDFSWSKVYGVGSGISIAHRFTQPNANTPFFIHQLSYQTDGADETLAREAE